MRYFCGFVQISHPEELDATPRIPRSSASWMHIWKHFKIQTKHRLAQRAPHVRVAIHDIAARVVGDALDVLLASAATLGEGDEGVPR